MTIVYGTCLVISAAVFVYMAQKNQGNIDANYWLVVILIPIVIMGYWLKTQVTTPEAAKALFCFIYFDSTVLLVAILFSMMHALGFRTAWWMKVVAYGAACIHVAIVCLGAHSDMYYQSMSVVPTVWGSATKMVGGPLRLYHYAFLAAMAAWFIGMVLASAIKQGTYSRRSFAMFGAVVGAGLVLHVLEGALDVDFTLLPILYVIGDVAIAANYDYVYAHDIGYVLSSQQNHFGVRGYAAVSTSRRFQSCNAKAFEFLPFLKTQQVDKALADDDEHAKLVRGLIDVCEENGFASAYYQIGDMTCACEVQPYSLKQDGEPQGYLLDIRDATEEVRNIRIVEEYNETLNEEVAQKTDNIRDMQRKIVLGMANVIENRDNNTGGHVKRTSEVVHILVDEIIRQGRIPVTDEMANDIVRAAPTHDLGKITIDSNILNKPGRFTDDEYEIMKTHAAKSGELVLILLDGVEEERFVNVAFNVARFHHERWDGRGYPEGRVGTMIPLEARIMAVADVYDALVSKRVYKEAMSFEKAHDIMLEGMGSQFDPSMKAVYLGCRGQLEDYYRQNAH